MKIILDSIQHIELKRQINEVLGQGKIVEIGKINGYGAYLKMDENLQIVSVYCKLHQDYDKENVYLLWNIVSDVFLNKRGANYADKPSTTKKNLLEKTFADYRWSRINSNLQKLFLTWVNNSPSNIIRQSNIRNSILEHRDTIPPSTIGEAHFYKVKGSRLLEDFRNRNMNLTFDIDPNKEYLQGAAHTQSVSVHLHFEGQGIAVQMYKFAENQTGLKIIPSTVLTPGGKALHRKLGNIK